MNSSAQRRWPTVVAGFGSPHGDDQAGWRAAERLARRADLPARVIAVREPTQLLDALPGCRRLIIIDACRSGGTAGEVSRYVWPDARIVVKHRHSTHGVGVAELLRLAEKLGDLPPAVEVVGIEVADCSPAGDLTPDVERAVADVEAEIVSVLCEVAHA